MTNSTEISSLYGVEHDFPNDSINILRNELSKLPPGTKVGIEYHPEITRLTTLQDQPIYFEKSAILYWEEVKRICEENHLEIVYLDDPELYKDIASSEISRAEALHKLQNGDYGDDEGEYWRLRRNLYRASIDSFFKTVIVRQRAILEEIIKNKPETVVIGSGHSVVLDSLKDKLGINIHSFLRHDGSPFEESEYIESMTDYELVKRRYHALKSFRLKENLSIAPSYVGVFLSDSDFYTPEEGMFEICLESTDDAGFFSGKLFDMLGDASLRGEFNGNKIIFCKRYVEEKSSQTASTTDIIYVGILKEDGSYEGKYYFSLRGGKTLMRSGVFLLRPFTSAKDVPQLLQDSLDVLNDYQFLSNVTLRELYDSIASLSRMH